MNKSEITDQIAIEELLWIKKDAEEILIKAKIGRPYKVGEHVWACPMVFVGVDKIHVDLKGVGSMQALGITMGHIKTRLGHLLDSGEKLRYLDDQKSEFDMDSLNAIFGK